MGKNGAGAIQKTGEGFGFEQLYNAAFPDAAVGAGDHGVHGEPVKIVTGGGNRSAHSCQGGQKQNCRQTDAQEGADADAQETEEEILKIKEVVDSVDDKGRKIYPYGAAYIFLLNTGLRLSEFAALDKLDIDFENKCVFIRRM